MKGKKNKKNKKNKNDNSNKNLLEEEYASILNDTVDEIPKLSEFLPKNFNNSNIKCYSLLTLSSWNPIVTTRKINGKIIILYNKLYINIIVKIEINEHF